jgi:RNA 3'-terminal phosphate cyclase (GTP)
MEPKLIDGSFGEGGGSILRLASGFSVLKRIPIRVTKIRANRKKPGLRLQHLRGLQLLENLTGGSLSRSEVGTTEIEFNPGKLSKKNLSINIETAGNIALLLQPVQIACLGLERGDKVNLEIKGGGTFGKWAPGTVFLEKVLHKIFETSGYRIELTVNHHGFYPKGGAQVKCEFHSPGHQIKPINIVELGRITQVKGKIVCADTLKKPQVAERIKNTIKSVIKQKLNFDCDIHQEYVKAYSTGVGLCIWAESDTNSIISSGTVLGEKGLSSENVGKKAANILVEYIKNEIPVDNYLADQLIPIMSIASGLSEIKVREITNHLKTNLEIIKLFNLGEYEINKVTDGYIVRMGI